MAITKTMSRARDLLLVVLSFIATGESCWYTMTLSPNHDHSLARRLGFCLNEEYYGFLVAAGLAGYFVNPKTGDKRVVMKPNEDGVFGAEEAARLVKSLTLAERDILLTEIVVDNTSTEKVLQFRNSRNKWVESYIRVPSNTTDKSFTRHIAWLDSAIKVNAGKAGTQYKSAKRMTKHLFKKYKDASMDALKEMKLMPPGKMNEVQMAAMYTAGGISSKRSRRVVTKHLRHHFGKHSFAPEYKVNILCDGHTEVFKGVLELPKTKEGAGEKIHYNEKNIADELAAQMARQLNYHGIKDPSRIKRIDVMAGGDHGQGAFIFGAKVVVILSGLTSQEEDESFSFEISVAEVLCKKDTAEILSKTIRARLTEGLRRIQEEKLKFRVETQDEGPSISCSYAATPAASAERNAELYIVGDLAFGAIVLGKDGMSSSWCPSCKIKAAEMPNLMVTGEPWKLDEMAKLGADYQKKLALFEKSTKKTPPKAQLGCKDAPWWPFIPIDHYIVPLLHCLIGIGDDILRKFREEVSEKIEYLTPEEIATRSHLAELEVKQAEARQECKDFGSSDEGKQLDSLVGKLKRAKISLAKIEGFTNTPGATAVSVKDDSPVDLFLQEVMNFIEYGDNDDEDGLEGTIDTPDDNDASDENEAQVTSTQQVAAADSSAPGENDSIRKKIAEVKTSMVEFEGLIKPLNEKRKKLTDRRNTAGAYIKRAKEHIKSFKSDRKTDDDGIETAMFNVLKDIYGIKLQAYHGGSLHGKDHQKIMDSADEIFILFAAILKDNAKSDCKLSHDEIDELCQKYSHLYMLWDGAFSYASIINPTSEDIVMYERFVTAAVHLHKDLGMSVTPKVHLMWKHVKHQMGFPGGLGEKREDWVEHQHQITRRLRTQFNSTKDMNVRADAMARLNQQQTNPKVQAYIDEVEKAAARGPRKNYTKANEARKEERKIARLTALDVWELETGQRE